MTNDDAVAAPIRELLTIFEAELREVRFGAIDATVLGAAAADVERAASEAAALERRLQESRQALGTAQEELAQKAQRALAHARLYAEEMPALAARLAAITLPRAGKKTSAPSAPAEVDGAPRRRGRPPKARAERDAPAGEASSDLPAGDARDRTLAAAE